MTNEAQRPTHPLFVTLLACPGWIVLALSILWRIWYEPQRDLANEFIDEGSILVMVAWFVAGVAMVALDKFRSKSDSEQRVWRIAALAFGLTVVGACLYAARILLVVVLTGLGASLIPLTVVGLILDIPANTFVFLFLVTSAIGTPAYMLYLTYRAIRSWWTYLRVA